MTKEEASELWDNPAFHQGRIYGREEARVLSDLLDGMSVKEAKRYEQGRMAERERIHKAFGDYYQHTCSQNFPQREGHICHLCNMHRLIKGETSE